MDFSKDYLFELFATKKFSDFRFTTPGEHDLPVHKVLLSAKSPIFKWYFQTRMGKAKKADLLDLVSCEGIMGYDDTDEASKAALRDALFDIISFCYMRSCSDCQRDNSRHFKVRVLSVLLTHALADRFEMADLVTFAENKFKNAFAWFCNNAEDDHVDAALEMCFSPVLLKEGHIRGRTLQLLSGTARWMFEQQIEYYKRTGQDEKAKRMMLAVPQAYDGMERQLADAERRANAKVEAKGKAKEK